MLRKYRRPKSWSIYSYIAFHTAKSEDLSESLRGAEFIERIYYSSSWGTGFAIAKVRGLRI